MGGLLPHLPAQHGRHRALDQHRGKGLLGSDVAKAYYTVERAPVVQAVRALVPGLEPWAQTWLARAKERPSGTTSS